MTINLETEFINIVCFDSEITHPNSRILYNDMYAFTKKKNTTKLPQNNCKDKYNILMLGIDSMSLPRLAQTMKRTINFFRDNFWLAYRGYHKVIDLLKDQFHQFLGKYVQNIIKDYLYFFRWETTHFRI